MSEHLPQETHPGTLRIGKWDNIVCANLDNGMRVISQRSFMEMLGMKGRGDTGHRILRLIAHPSLKGLSYLKLALDIENPAKYRTKNGFIAHGYDSEILIAYCKAVLKAREFGLLGTDPELRYAQAAESLIISIANVGLIALIDEATGYRRDQDKETLQSILDKFLMKEQAKWAKRFPDEFYELMFHLKGWHWKGMAVNRPSVVGRYTNDVIYQRLAPGVLEELRRLNPKDDKGQRKSRHHQWLTIDVGHPALNQHLHSIIGLMRASTNWSNFLRLLERAFPKLNDTIPLRLEDGQGHEV